LKRAKLVPAVEALEVETLEVSADVQVHSDEDFYDAPADAKNSGIDA
jgi:hypothetical protein